MKLFLKMLAAVSSVLVLSATVSLAATYDSDKGQVNLTDADKGDITDNNMIAVMVVPADKVDKLSSILAEDILYIDQGTAFETFVNMGVKGSSLDAGKYAICVGANTAAEPNIQYFEVGDVSGDKKEADSIGMVYKASAASIEGEAKDFLYVVQIDKFNSSSTYGLKMSFDGGDKTMSAKFPISTNVFNGITGGASIKIGVVMQGVDSNYSDSFTATPYLENTVAEG